MQGLEPVETMQKIALVTDAWAPQINGVVTTLSSVVGELEAAGHDVGVIHPGLFLTVPMPSYPEIRLAAAPYLGTARRLLAWRPDAVHIATEGPCGLAARAFCLRHGWCFTTSFHTKFPEYIHARLGVLPVRTGYGVLRRFHQPAAHTLVSTPAFSEFLSEHGFSDLRLWPRGVDTKRFKPWAGNLFSQLPRPLFAYLGRVAVEKNIGV
ncbi:glycosyltransferase [Spectribacter hydrogenooxidans]|uniref:Glycosyltransferase n=1 Tax=Spectribacter hydrogenoxidans TaxID=3075608 RepID=A0ABU3C400_9GAMM|nr:glycosyltransferase [Salinisphaera sp. W335]MDT0636270.1 glycosyltransferase [Salinisphaera sp. W335]